MGTPIACNPVQNVQTGQEESETRQHLSQKSPCTLNKKRVNNQTQKDPVTSLMYSNIKKRMDRPKFVVGVIRGAVTFDKTVDVSCLLCASSGIYGVHFLKAIGNLSMSQCATGPARESRVCFFVQRSLLGGEYPT